MDSELTAGPGQCDPLKAMSWGVEMVVMDASTGGPARELTTQGAGWWGMLSIGTARPGSPSGHLAGISVSYQETGAWGPHLSRPEEPSCLGGGCVGEDGHWAVGLKGLFWPLMFPYSTSSLVFSLSAGDPPAM